MPWAGDLTERLTNDSLRQTQAQYVSHERTTSTPGETIYAARQAEPVAAPVIQPTKQDIFRTKYYSFGARAGRIAGSSFAIAWSLTLLVFFNFFNQYIAYYRPEYASGATQWQMHTLITSDFNSWLPLLTATLVVCIIGHIVLIIFARFTLRQIVNIILDVLGAATVASLLAIFPFDFSVIPNVDAAYWTQTGVTIGLIVLALGYGIGALARFIHLFVNIAEGKYQSGKNFINNNAFLKYGAC